MIVGARRASETVVTTGFRFPKCRPTALRVKGCKGTKGSNFPRDKQGKFLHCTISPPGKWLSFGSSLTRATREGEGREREEKEDKEGRNQEEEW